MDREKKVSIIIPCYNQSQFLSDALDSVLDQTYPHWECVIVNDGSSDDTESVAKKYVEKDNRFKYVFQSNKGLPAARNLGVHESSGELILPLDSDDKISQNYLAAGVDAFSKNKDLTILYCKAEKFGAESGEWNLPEFTLERMLESNIIFCSGIFKKEDFERVGGYDETFTQGWEDWDFWLSLLELGGGVRRLDECHFYYRIRNASMVRLMKPGVEEQLRRRIYYKHLKLYRKNFPDPITLKNELTEMKYSYELRLKQARPLNELSFKRLVYLFINRLVKKIRQIVKIE